MAADAETETAVGIAGWLGGWGLGTGKECSKNAAFRPC